MTGKEFIILAADIGGTNSRFALFRFVAGKSLTLLSECWFATQDHFCFAHLLSSLQSSSNFFEQPIDGAVIAGPGPIADGVCHPPNIPWSIDGKEVTSRLGIPQVLLVNDFMAQGYACLLAQEPSGAKILDVARLWPGDGSPIPPHSPVAVLGAGSGCGKVTVLPHQNLVLPSEGGHATFPFITDEEWAFSKFMKDRLCVDEVTHDHILSGRGLALLYAFHSGNDLLPESVSIILNEADLVPNPLAEITLTWYARFLGRAARTFALETLALGGIVITGGMASRIPVLTRPDFLLTVQRSLTHSWLLTKIPVYHMQSQQAGLYGAAYYGVLCLVQEKKFSPDIGFAN